MNYECDNCNFKSNDNDAAKKHFEYTISQHAGHTIRGLNSEAEEDQKVDPKKLAWDTANKLIESNHFVTLQDTEEIYRYQDGVYELGAEAFIKQYVQDGLTKETISTHLVKEVIGHVQRSTLKSREIFDEGNPHLVLENCLYDMRSGQSEDFTPDYYALAKMPVRYVATIDYHQSLFWTFINEILSPEDVKGVQEEIGQILAKDYLTKKFSIYEGVQNTGKTTLLNVIQALLGEKNVSNLSLQQIASKERFYLSRLFGKMANIRDDMPKDIIKSASALKEVTGRSKITGEFKFQDPFEFTNHAYIIVSCNQLPPFEEDDLAVFDRIKLRQFKNRFGGHEKPDRELEKKLTTPEELSAVLNFAIDGLERLKAQGWNFSHEEKEIETRDYYKRKADPLWGFVEDCLEETGNSQDYIEKQELYNKSREYCQEKNLPEITKDYFYKHLGDKITVRSERRGSQGKQKHCFVGICLLNKESLDYPDYPSSTELNSQPSQPSQGSSYLSGENSEEYISHWGPGMRPRK